MKQIKYAGFQGDVVIFEIDAFPEGERIQDNQTKNAILAYGEATGHAHQFSDVDAVEVFRNKDIPGLLFIDMLKATTLIHGRARDFQGLEVDHDYHNPINLDPGKKYFIGIVEETDWINKTIRKVVD